MNIKKFINHQRWVMNNNKLEKMHPCICMNSENLDKFKDYLSFTPNDCYELYQCIYDSIRLKNDDLEDVK